MPSFLREERPDGLLADNGGFSHGDDFIAMSKWGSENVAWIQLDGSNGQFRSQVRGFFFKKKKEQREQIALAGNKLRDCCHLVRLLGAVLAPGAASRAMDLFWRRS